MTLMALWIVLMSGAETSSLRMDDLVITGTRTEKTLDDVPVRTEVVREEQISDQNYSDLKQIVEDIPGITLQPTTGRPGTAPVIQGLGDEHVLVLIDSVPRLQKSNSGFDLSDISTADIERIEVIKGGASSLYGSQAMGGVINIITKKPTNKTEVRFDTQAGQTTFGRFDVPASETKGQVRGRARNIGYKVTVSGRHRGTYDADPETIAEDASGYEKTSVSGYLDREFSDHWKTDLNIQFRRETTRSNHSERGSSGFYELRENSSEANNGAITWGIQRDEGDTNFQTKLHYESISDRLILADDPSTSSIDSEKASEHRFYRAESQWTTLVGESHLVTAGFVVSSKSLDQSNLKNRGSSTAVSIKEIDEKSQTSYEVFVQDDWVGEKVEVVPGLRAQYDNDFGSHVSPKISVRYSPESRYSTMNVRGSIASGYRSPNLKERFYVLDHSSFANYVVEGNAELQPESSVSYQAGIEIGHRRQWNTYADLFLNEVRNLIDVQEDNSADVLRYQYTNFKEVQSVGFELGAKYHWTSNLLLNPTWVRAETRDRSNGRLIPRRPIDTLGLGISYHISNRWGFHTKINHQGESYTDAENTAISPAHSLIDLSINHQMNDQTRFFFGINNILDTRRSAEIDGTSDIDYRPSIGRTAFLGLSIRR